MAQKKNKVIADGNFPLRYPVNFTILMILCLDYYSAPGWLCGAGAFVLFLLWIVIFIARRNQEAVDIVHLLDDTTIDVLKKRIEQRMQEREQGSIDENKTNLSGLKIKVVEGGYGYEKPKQAGENSNNQSSQNKT